MIKKLKWLINHQNELKELLEKQTVVVKKETKEQTYSLAGVPEYQLKYIDDKLKDDSVK